MYYVILFIYYTRCNRQTYQYLSICCFITFIFVVFYSLEYFVVVVVVVYHCR